ncbi:hypothetical protein [Flavivirga algicola]|uniref:Outer membrane protein beta-barrel domain-containing protein n=1 Tax=Flavivirga algicola TaxID=2729136 RepID=A0ABX1S1A0_9FLAO|nr:hypothetical protein [Flavivirga algicola]NMH88479.1 hypothetical protein [Flavivirga algicola]
MKKELIIITVLICGLKLSAQTDTLSVTNSKDYYDAFDGYLNKITFNFGIGAFVPKGNLKTYFGDAPLFEISVSFPLKKAKSLEAVFQIIIPDQQEDFLFLRTIDTINVKSTSMFNGFIRFKKSVQNSRKSKVNLGLGIGVSTITTNARNPFYNGRKDESKYEFISSLLLIPGLAWSYTFSEHAKFTLGLDLQYSPYKIEGALREDIGQIALIPKISYRF